MSEWRPVIEKLLLMSYRLSAVVSPVIQSSSPEGLIPMDTDSGQQMKQARISVFFVYYPPSPANLSFGKIQKLTRWIKKLFILTSDNSTTLVMSLTLKKRTKTNK